MDSSILRSSFLYEGEHSAEYVFCHRNMFSRKGSSMIGSIVRCRSSSSWKDMHDQMNKMQHEIDTLRLTSNASSDGRLAKRIDEAMADTATRFDKETFRLKRQESTTLSVVDRVDGHEERLIQLERLSEATQEPTTASVTTPSVADRVDAHEERLVHLERVLVTQGPVDMEVDAEGADGADAWDGPQECERKDEYGAAEWDRCYESRGRDSQWHESQWRHSWWSQVERKSDDAADAAATVAPSAPPGTVDGMLLVDPQPVNGVLLNNVDGAIDGAAEDDNSDKVNELWRATLHRDIRVNRKLEHVMKPYLQDLMKHLTNLDIYVTTVPPGRVTYCCRLCLKTIDGTKNVITHARSHQIRDAYGSASRETVREAIYAISAYWQ